MRAFLRLDGTRTATSAVTGRHSNQLNYQSFAISAVAKI